MTLDAIEYTENPHQIPGRIRALADDIRHHSAADGREATAAALEAMADEWETANPPPPRGWIPGEADDDDGHPSRNRDGRFRCDCGAVIEVPWRPGADFDCESCRRSYNSGGQLLAPREQWGEETGEHPADVARAFQGGDTDTIEEDRNDGRA